MLELLAWLQTVLASSLMWNHSFFISVTVQRCFVDTSLAAVFIFLSWSPNTTDSAKHVVFSSADFQQQDSKLCGVKILIFFSWRHFCEWNLLTNEAEPDGFIAQLRVVHYANDRISQTHTTSWAGGGHEVETSDFTPSLVNTTQRGLE